MGTVWAAVHELTGRPVALKLIARASNDLRRRLLRDARACRGVSHRNVVDVVDVGETDSGDPFIVMELLSGETLAELIARRRRLDAREATQIARDVARALAAAHAVGLFHRDLKPANIFLHRQSGEDEPIVKVLDFGVCKELGAYASMSGPIGSPAYMSPEQIRGVRDFDSRTDIWSLGVILFEMLTGGRPFQGEPQEVIGKILDGEVATMPMSVRPVDPALMELVSRCLERSRDRRSASAEELAEMLHCYVSAGDQAKEPQPGGTEPLSAAAQPVVTDTGAPVETAPGSLAAPPAVPQEGASTSAAGRRPAAAAAFAIGRLLGRVRLRMLFAAVSGAAALTLLSLGVRTALAPTSQIPVTVAATAMTTPVGSPFQVPWAIPVYEGSTTTAETSPLRDVQSGSVVHGTDAKKPAHPLPTVKSKGPSKPALNAGAARRPRGKSSSSNAKPCSSKSPPGPSCASAREGMRR